MCFADLLILADIKGILVACRRLGVQQTTVRRDKPHGIRVTVFFRRHSHKPMGNTSTIISFCMQLPVYGTLPDKFLHATVRIVIADNKGLLNKMSHGRKVVLRGTVVMLARSAAEGTRA